MPDDTKPAEEGAAAAPADTAQAPPATQDAAAAEVPPNPSVPAAPASAGTDEAAHRAPAFLRLVQAWANGQDVPDSAVIRGCLEDLRATLGERQQIQQQAQQLEATLREQQAQLYASQGREDGLLRVMYRAQAT